MPRDVDSSFFRNAVLAKADFEIMLLSMLNRILDPALRFLFRRSLPSIDGVFKAEELEHPEDASIERDGYGIPPWGCSPQRYRSVLLGDHVRLCDLYNDNVGRTFGGIFQESACAHRKDTGLCCSGIMCVCAICTMTTPVEHLGEFFKKASVLTAKIGEHVERRGQIWEDI